MAARLRRHGLLLTALVLSALPAIADENLLPVAWRIAGESLAATVDLRRVATEDLHREFESGLTNRVIVSVGLWRSDEEGHATGAPLAMRVRRCSLVFDLWTERYDIEIREGRRRWRQTVSTFADVSRVCLYLDRLRLLPLAGLDLRSPYVLQARVDVNPQDPQLVEQARDYLGDPLGHRREGEGGGTLISAVAKIFLPPEPTRTDRSIRMRSPPLDADGVSALLRRSRTAGEEKEKEEE